MPKFNKPIMDIQKLDIEDFIRTSGCPQSHGCVECYCSVVFCDVWSCNGVICPDVFDPKA